MGLLRAVPDFFGLLWRLVRDPRVSRLDRLFFALTLGYLVTPVDLVPDWLPAVGQLDDLLLVGLAVDRLLYRTDEEVLLELWRGDPETLLELRGWLERAVDVLPGWSRKLLRAG